MPKKREELTEKKETYGLGFVPSKETLDAIKEGIALSKTADGGFDNFDELWEAMMSDEY